MDTQKQEYGFEDFTLNLLRKELLRVDTNVGLSHKEFDVLRVLIERSPETLSHDEIIKLVWNGTSVENSSVEKAIANIRKVLDDDARNPKYIKTIYGEGYRFIAESGVNEDQLEDVFDIEPGVFVEEISEVKIPSNSKATFVLVGILAVMAFSGLFYWKGEEFWTRMNKEVIFVDDFSKDQLDKSKWKFISGKTLKIEDGVLKMTVDQADNYPKLTSPYFSFDPNKTMMIKSRMKVQYMQFSKDKTYFGGNFAFIPKTPESDSHKGMKPLIWGISYNNYDFEGAETNRKTGQTTEYIKVEGFYLVRDGGRASTKKHYDEGKVGPRIEPIWGEWFDQKIVYKPWSGEIEILINGEKQAEYNVGKLREDRIGNQLRFWVHPSGWYLHHSMEIDYIEVTQ